MSNKQAIKAVKKILAYNVGLRKSVKLGGRA